MSLRHILSLLLPAYQRLLLGFRASQHARYLDTMAKVPRCCAPPQLSEEDLLSERLEMDVSAVRTRADGAECVDGMSQCRYPYVCRYLDPSPGRCRIPRRSFHHALLLIIEVDSGKISCTACTWGVSYSR